MNTHHVIPFPTKPQSIDARRPLTVDDVREALEEGRYTLHYINRDTICSASRLPPLKRVSSDPELIRRILLCSYHSREVSIGPGEVHRLNQTVCGNGVKPI